MSLSKEGLLKKLLLGSGGKGRGIWAGLALLLGTLFLLLAVLLWWNFRQALSGNNGTDALGSGFFVVSKNVSDANMSNPAQMRFTPTQIIELKSAPQVEDVGEVSQASFPVWASLGGQLKFSTMMFLEAVPTRFLDTIPAGWEWTPDRSDVPLLLAKEFLRTYNYVFAPTQNLPQLSENAVQAIGFRLTLGADDVPKADVRAQVLGFSDRINSVLVPQSFLDAMNQRFGTASLPPARLLVRATDPANPALLQWLREHDYQTGAENERNGKLRTVVTGVSAGMGVLAVVLLATGLGLFLALIELLMTRAAGDLKLLIEIGYQPKMLRQFFLRRAFPLVAGALMLALVLAALLNVGASVLAGKMGIYWPVVPPVPVWGAWVLVAGLVFWQLWRRIGRAMAAA